MLAFVANGIANAVPATLLVFYVTDRLQAPQWTPWLLATYFACGMLSRCRGGWRACPAGAWSAPGPWA
jgi:GPH family glycoside/pentoside/hexuronide:cation symporter